MILERLKKLILPVRGTSAAEEPLVKRTVEGSIPSPGAISRAGESMRPLTNAQDPGRKPALRSWPGTVASPSPSDSGGLSGGAFSRRRFFSFFGTGVAMLAKPDLFVPTLMRPSAVTIDWATNRVIAVHWEKSTQKWNWSQHFGKWLPLDVAIKEWQTP